MKIALVVDSVNVSKYVYDLAEWGVNNPNVEFSIIILKHIKIQKWFKYFILKKFESFYIKKHPLHYNHYSLFNLKSSSFPVIMVDVNTDLATVREMGADLLINCCYAILPEEIFSMSRFGILVLSLYISWQTGGFWEVYFRKDQTFFSIKQYTDKPENEKTVFAGAFPTQLYFSLNQAVLCLKSFFYLKEIVNCLAQNQTLSSFKSNNEFLASPHIREVFHSIFRMICKSFSLRLVKLFFHKQKVYQWGVAFQHTHWLEADLAKGIKISNPPDHFLADPFVITYNGVNYCFVEDFAYNVSKGIIAVYRLCKDHAERSGEALVEPYHLSFPYLFQFESKMYMLPDTRKSGELRLYECFEFPLKWQLKTVLMKDVNVVDTMVFNYNKTWWLLTNMDPGLSGERCSELFLFYSDDLFSGKWHPHPANPIYVDSNRARNGGLLYDKNGAIYRVSQRQGYNLYGKSTSINKIVYLDKFQYKEQELSQNKPDFFSNIAGTHHMHGNNEVVVFDYAQWVYR
jgi:hypothetical protein